MLDSPWDDCRHAQVVRLVRSPDALPPTSDGGEHPVIAVHVHMPPADDPADPRFSIGFETLSGRCLRVRLPPDQLRQLAEVLMQLAEERRFHGDV
jgi:hypothetical protein